MCIYAAYKTNRTNKQIKNKNKKKLLNYFQPLNSFFSLIFCVSFSHATFFFVPFPSSVSGKTHKVSVGAGGEKSRRERGKTIEIFNENINEKYE